MLVQEVVELGEVQMELTQIQHIMVRVDMELLCQAEDPEGALQVHLEQVVPVVIVQVDMEEQVVAVGMEVVGLILMVVVMMMQVEEEEVAIYGHPTMPLITLQVVA